MQEGCAYCERKLDRIHTLNSTKLSPTVDHIVPICEGGLNESKNRVLVCRECNCDIKAGRNPWVFLYSIKWYITNNISLLNYTREQLTNIYRNLYLLLNERGIAKPEGFVHSERLWKRPDRKPGQKNRGLKRALSPIRKKVKAQKQAQIVEQFNANYKPGTSLVWKEGEETYYGYMFEMNNDPLQRQMRYYKEFLGFNHPDRIDIEGKRRLIKYVGTFTKIDKSLKN